jgi:hypothetical protein
LQPVGCHRGQRVERGAEGFRHEFEPVEDADRGEDVGRVSTLLPASLEQAECLAALEQLVEEQFFGTAGQQAVPEFAQDRKVEPRIGQFETQQILPVDTRPDGLCRLAIREIFPKLHDRHER